MRSKILPLSLYFCREMQTRRLSWGVFLLVEAFSTRFEKDDLDDGWALVCNVYCRMNLLYVYMHFGALKKKLDVQKLSSCIKENTILKSFSPDAKSCFSRKQILQILGVVVLDSQVLVDCYGLEL